MKNSFIYFIILFFLNCNVFLIAGELEINSTKITYDNNNKTTIFEGNVTSSDQKGNKIFSEYAKYDKLKDIIETKGATKIMTSNGYEVLGSNITLDNKKNIIYSNYKTIIIDKDGNNISTDMFNYSILTNIFFSKGNIKIKDINENKYNFSEIYIDENSKKIIGSDIRAFLNQPNITTNSDNEPRFFANTISISEGTSKMEKGIFTYCKKKKGEKCPPWTLQSEKIEHNLANKTIYYDNVVLKIYDFPIFYSPKFSHPDPTVKRRSGFLVPSLSNSTNLGSGFVTPYFFNIADDKDLTLTPKFYFGDNPLLLAEYRQDFIDSFLIVDAGYTQGYKNKNNIKSPGGRAHFFSNFNMNFTKEEEKESGLEINLEKVSNDTYFNVYDIKSSLVDKSKTILENRVDLTYQHKDFFVGLAPSAYEDTNKIGHLRHEYILPLNIEKNIIASEKFGFLDLGSNLRVRNYDTNKQSSFFINDFNWKSNKWLSSVGIENYFEGLVKNVNYEAQNTDNLKNNKKISEVNSVLGYFATLALYKENLMTKSFESFTPRFLLRYAPGHMRKAEGGRLNYSNIFNLNKVNKPDVLEPGLSTSVGFEYKRNELDNNNLVGKEKLSISIAQVISEKENMDIPASTSLDQQFSDVVGETRYSFNDKLSLEYNFSIDQGYKNFNYNEVGADFSFSKAKFNIDYLQEKKHIGNQEYVQTGVDFKLNNSTELNFNTKRNLLTSSAEFYNLSYNYINDCLKAGIAYRREFYTDRDIEPTNSLMFTISIIPFANINTPRMSK